MLNYIPKYVRQESELEFGDLVTHENYNAKLNLNTTQGDYNSEVLDKLFNTAESEDTYHIPYIDSILESHTNDLTTLLNRASTEDTMIEEAANNTYYGKNSDGVVGFMNTPEYISADLPDRSIVVGDIQITPTADTVTEAMLTQDVRTKLNAPSITSYNDLTDVPSINNIALTGNVTLDSLGVQPAGSYLTDSEVRAIAPVIQVGEFFVGAPKEGDILITV